MTGAGMMDCKNALTEANGDFDTAVEIIRKKGQAVAAKRSDREASEGCVLAGTNGGFAAALALKCETDFVAKNADFVALTQSILDKALEAKPTTQDELLALVIDGRSIAEHITERTGITGEKTELDYYEFVEGGTVTTYIHPGNKLATIVAFAEKDAEYETMQGIRTTNPVVVGDRVGVEVNEGQLSLITTICDRRNVIIRRASNLSKQGHILAANIDLAALVVTVKHPETSTVFIDRFLASAESYGVPSVLVFNKTDLYSEEDNRYLDALIMYGIYLHLQFIHLRCTIGI